MSTALKLGIVLAIVSVLSALGSAIYTAGRRAERAEYAERDNRALQAAIKARDEANAKVAEVESHLQAETTKIEMGASNEIEKVNQAANATISKLYDGTLRLRKSLTACSAASDRGTTGQAGSAAGSAAETAQGGLQRKDVEFLVRFGRECDAVTVERNEAVAIALKDRQLTTKEKP